MRIVLLGVRGSTPAPGPDYLRYGGHTSALAILRDGELRPSLLLDAGTGLRELPRLMDGEPFRGDIVLSHLHWDHVQGLPFTAPLDDPGASVRLHVPVRPGEDPGASLARELSPPAFPVGLDGLLGRWEAIPADSGWTDDRFRVGVVPVAHKGGMTVGIRVEADGASAAYLPDHALNPMTADSDVARAVELVRGVDLLLHDGHFTAAEVNRAIGYGHATIERALAFADDAEVGALVLTHHAPNRTDEALDALADRFRRTPQGRPVIFGRQGVSLPVPTPGREVPRATFGEVTA